MDHLLTEHGLCLTYLRTQTIDDLDQERIIDDLSDDTSEGDPLPWLTRYRLAEYDHLVLVTDGPVAAIWHFLAPTTGPLNAKTSCCWKPPLSPQCAWSEFDADA